MKKRLFCLALIIAILTMTACGISPAEPTEAPETGFDVSTPESDDNVFSYTTSSGQTHYSLSEIPHDMIFGDNVLPLDRVVFFEQYENHGYMPFIIVEISRENLSDDDIYWMTKYDSNKHCKELDINVYVDSEDNGLDTNRLTYCGSVYDSQYMYFIFFYADICRYSFMGSEFSCQIIYTPTGITESDTVHYYYDLIVDGDTYEDSDDVLTESEKKAFTQVVNKYLGN